MQLAILDNLTDPGSATRPNEDCYGASVHRAFVIDGATGLGNVQAVEGHGSDAAWLAAFARETFLELDHLSVPDMVRETNRRAMDMVGRTAEGPNLADWAMPIAGFQMLCLEPEGLVTYGLGDCRLFLSCDETGAAFDTSAIKGSHAAEREKAREAIEKTGGLAKLASLSLDPSVQQDLRASRARYNKAGGQVWTLGTVPEAADHVARERLDFAGPVTGLLCTDGFAALCDQYGFYDGKGLVAAARQSGLAALMAELRHVERVSDPDGQAFPRYKISDDATAVLFETRPASP